MKSQGTYALKTVFSKTRNEQTQSKNHREKLVTETD